MQVTRRYWTIMGAVIVFAVGGGLFARPLLLLGAAGLSAWLLAKQYSFVHHLCSLDDGLTLDQSITPDRVPTGVDARASLSAAVDGGSPLSVTVTASPPVGVVVSGERRCSVVLETGEKRANTEYGVRAPVAGRFTLDSLTVTVRDSDSLFEERLTRGEAIDLTVEPRRPQNVHVGQGGEELASAFGEHDTGRLGIGLEPAEVREYVPGDAASRIDWKATARLGSLFVREYETKTDRTTALVVDHRATTDRGRDGETKLDYLREVALAFLGSAREYGDPLGLYAVGDEGVTSALSPTASADQYERVRAIVSNLEPTDETVRSSSPGRSPASAHADADQLASDESAFARTLTPYLRATETYVHRVADGPLFAAVETYPTRPRNTVWTVIVTDDEHRAELREAVKVARGDDDHAVVILAPTVLYEIEQFDPETAYDRYREFEDYRRSLDRLERVTALELAPGDRLDAILTARRDRHRARAEATPAVSTGTSPDDRLSGGGS